MKKLRLFTTSLLVALATSLAAQPQATWLERHHDFGVFMEQDGKVSCQMRLTNTGDKPLLIVKAQAGCGCTVVNFPEDAIMPGDTATVSITYNPSGRPGQFTKQALIFTNTTTKRSILEITGNVIPTAATLDKQYPVKAGSLRISQQNLPLGELTRGKNKTEYLSAYNASTDTVMVTVMGFKPHLRLAVVPDTVPPARVTALTVHYLSGKAPLWGLNTDTVMVFCRSLRHRPTDGPVGMAEIQVMAQVIEDFDSLSDKDRNDAPVISVDCGDRIDLGTFTKQGERVTRTFTITNRGKRPLAIRRLWVPDGEGITVTANRTEIKRGKSATVTVTVDTSRQQGDLLNVPLTVMTNDPVTPRLTIRLVGIIDKQ